MEDVIITVNSWQWPYYKPIHDGFAEGAGDAVQVTALNPGDGVSFQMSVTANEKQELNVDVQRIAMSKGATVQVLEQENGRWVSLAEASLDKPDNISLIFTPTQGNVQIQVSGPVQTLITKLCLYAYQEVEKDELVTICSEDKDKYRWGYGTQEKVNEWSGIGNHYTAKFWEYDTRTGRRLNLDPKPTIGFSDYAVFLNSPIIFNDFLGDEVESYRIAEALNNSLSDKGDERGNSHTQYKDAIISPVYNKKGKGDVIGYYVYDSKNVEKNAIPILQMNKGDLGDFKKHYDVYMNFGRTTARVGAGKIEALAALKSHNLMMGLHGAWEINKNFWTNPRCVASVIMMWATAGVGAMEEAPVATMSEEAAETVPQYTKSSLKLGQEMHKAYKVGADGIKEFRLPSGKRIDFLDINNRTIYELKPFNPRAMKAGQKQLDMYLKELQTIPEYKGFNWKTVLDTY